MARFGKAAHAHAVNQPLSFAGARDFGAEGLHRFGGIKGVFALEHAADTRLTDSERAQNERPNRDGFVAGHPGAASQRAGAAGGERDGVGVHCSWPRRAPWHAPLARLKKRRLSRRAASRHPPYFRAKAQRIDY